MTRYDDLRSDCRTITWGGEANRADSASDRRPVLRRDQAMNASARTQAARLGSLRFRGVGSS
jgi:hypothetical protein